jgi:hypothetical protein
LHRGHDASAQSDPTCTFNADTQLLTELRRPFRISSLDIGDLSGVTSSAARLAIVAAASAWDEQSNARAFRYLGTTLRSDLPMTKAECDSAGINYSLVRVIDDDGGGDYARLEDRCVNPSTDKAEQFVIKIFTEDANSNALAWETRGTTIAANELDLVGVMAHEFGHAFNVGHAAPGQYGTMLSPADNGVITSILGESRYRDLYRYDTYCVKLRAGDRQTRARRRVHGFGEFLAEEGYLGTWPIAKVSAGFTWNPEFNWASAAFSSDPIGQCVFWERGHRQLYANCIPTAEPFRDRLTQFTEVHFMEDAALQDRIFFMTDEEFAERTHDAQHRMRTRYSTNGFLTSTGSQVSECQSMSGFLTCGLSIPIAATRAPAVAFDDYSDRSVFAWTHQSRALKSRNRQVRVAVGYTSNNTVSIAEDLGVQSIAAPGVACKSFQAAGSYDCMVAAVSEEDTNFNIQIRRFWASNNGQRYTLQRDPNVTTISGAPTAGRIAAWYKDDEQAWFIAYRSLASNQPLTVLRSTDTLTWTQVSSFSAYSDIGPSAASYSTGFNALLYVN